MDRYELTDWQWQILSRVIEVMGDAWRETPERKVVAGWYDSPATARLLSIELRVDAVRHDTGVRAHYLHHAIILQQLLLSWERSEHHPGCIASWEDWTGKFEFHLRQCHDALAENGGFGVLVGDIASAFPHIIRKAEVAHA